jgi:hypothetical protein
MTAQHLASACRQYGATRGTVATPRSSRSMTRGVITNVHTLVGDSASGRDFFREPACVVTIPTRRLEVTPKADPVFMGGPSS